MQEDMEHMLFNDNTLIDVGESQVEQSDTGNIRSKQTVETTPPTQPEDRLDLGYLTFLENQPIHPLYLPTIKNKVSVLSIYAISVNCLPEVYWVSEGQDSRM